MYRGVNVASTLIKSAEASAMPKVKTEADMRWLWRFIDKHRFAWVMSIVTGIVGGVTTAYEPYFIGIIIDKLGKPGVTITEVSFDIAFLIGLSLITVASFYGQRYYSGQVAYGVHFDVRAAVFENMLTLDNDFYKQYPTGDLISRMYSDMEWVWRLLALGFNRAGLAVTAFFMTLVLLGTVNVPLTVVAFLILAISTGVQMRLGLFLIPEWEKVQAQAGKMSALVQDSVTGIQTIKTFGREADVNRAFRKETETFRDLWQFYKRRNEPLGMLPQMISYLTTGMVVLVGGMMAVNGQITIGNFAQFLLYLGLISRVLLMIGTTYQRYVQTQGALKRLTPLLQEPNIKDEPDAVALKDCQGEIVFENVGLMEDGKWLIRNVNLTIPSGSVVGLVGPTGSGKSILVNLLSRVTDVDEGRVTVDGIDVRDIKLKSLRSAVAYVPQQTFLFSQPLHENVRMGNAAISDVDLDRALMISRVSNDLPQMPDGLNTLVGEKGVMLSGGQKQRVAIARAIARNPSIMVLDDALSSVDTQTAAEILSSLRGVLNTRTSIIIAQRMATVKDADFIVVMNYGEIVEQGKHAELIETAGLYASMVEREAQQEGEMLK
jgi:ATP-binding cassette subfamily B multidrug efflux pump